MQTDALSAAATAIRHVPHQRHRLRRVLRRQRQAGQPLLPSAFGFQLMPTAGPETGVRDRASYLLQQNKIRFVLTTPLRPDHPIAEHVRAHGDGVRDIALWVDDARDAFRKAVERGAEAVQEPTVLRDDDGEVVLAAIRTYGDTIHSLGRAAELSRALPARLPPGRARATGRSQCGLQYVDHCVGNVELGRMNQWVGFYERVMGFMNLISLRRQGHLHRVLRAHVEGDVQRQRADQVSDQRAGRRARRSRRSTSTWSSTAARECSTSRSRPTTSSRR